MRPLGRGREDRGRDDRPRKPYFPGLPSSNLNDDGAIQWLSVRTINTAQVIGGWRDWTPTLTNITLGNGTQTARYIEMAKLVVAEYALVFGSTSAMGTAPTVSLPVTAVDVGGSENNQGTGEAHDDSLGNRYPLAVRGASTLVALAHLSGSPVIYTSITATAPFTWTTSDVIQFTITYEAA